MVAAFRQRGFGVGSVFGDEGEGEVKNFIYLNIFGDNIEKEY